MIVPEMNLKQMTLGGPGGGAPDAPRSSTTAASTASSSRPEEIQELIEKEFYYHRFELMRPLARERRSPEDCQLPQGHAHSTERDPRPPARRPNDLVRRLLQRHRHCGRMIDAILSLELDREKVVVIAGIGCAGRITQYLDYSTVHTTHGRALAVATGAKLADPALHVIVVMGDGDCAAIGGNHLIHAARRNIDLTARRLQQLDLRHDRRPDEPHHLRGRPLDDEPSTATSSRPSTSASWPVPPGRPTSPAAPPTATCRLVAAHRRRHRAQGLLVRRGDGRLPHLLRPPERQAPTPSRCCCGSTTRGGAGREVRPATARASQDRYPVGVLHHVERAEYIGGLRGSDRACRGLLASEPESSRSGSRDPAGRGIILAATVLADAAAAGREVVQTQSYGPEARGGASQGRGHRLRRGDRLPRGHGCPTSRSASRRRPSTATPPQTRAGGVVLYDGELVEPRETSRACACVGVPFTDARRARARQGVAANMVALGALAQA